jgi:hypothetical protein
MQFMLPSFLECALVTAVHLAAAFALATVGDALATG